MKPRRPGSGKKQDDAMTLATPDRKRREVRELYLPEISKNAWVQSKEINLGTLYEDPMFTGRNALNRRKFSTGPELKDLTGKMV